MTMLLLALLTIAQTAPLGPPPLLRQSIPVSPIAAVAPP
jgi:hypothetical protein